MSRVKVTPNYDPSLERIYQTSLEEFLPKNCKVSVMSYAVEHEDEFENFMHVDVLQNGKMQNFTFHSLEEAKSILKGKYDI